MDLDSLLGQMLDDNRAEPTNSGLRWLYQNITSEHSRTEQELAQPQADTQTSGSAEPNLFGQDEPAEPPDFDLPVEAPDTPSFNGPTEAQEAFQPEVESQVFQQPESPSLTFSEAQQAEPPEMEQAVFNQPPDAQVTFSETATEMASGIEHMGIIEPPPIQPEVTPARMPMYELGVNQPFQPQVDLRPVSMAPEPDVGKLPVRGIQGEPDESYTEGTRHQLLEQQDTMRDFVKLLNDDVAPIHERYYLQLRNEYSDWTNANLLHTQIFGRP